LTGNGQNEWEVWFSSALWTAVPANSPILPTAFFYDKNVKRKYPHWGCTRVVRFIPRNELFIPVWERMVKWNNLLFSGFNVFTEAGIAEKARRICVCSFFILQG
jgi:hypothetical protein